MIGMQYVTWFGLEGAGSGCQGSGWRDRPFGLDGVQSLAFGAHPDGFCYSSWDPGTALVHAGLLAELNVDFVILDDTNLSKAMRAEDNPIHQCNLKVLEGLRQYSCRKIRSVMMQSITNWNAAHGEVFAFNEYVQSHIDSIARQHLASPDDFLSIGGKPVLLFYISQGSNVYRADGSFAFHGAGNIAPTAADFDCRVNVPGAPRLREFFAVRYAVVADSEFDYRPYSPELWPFQCNYGRASFSEAAYASLLAPRLSGGRSIDLFNSLVDEGRDKPFLIIRVWNEFSSTDEQGGHAYTIEPNTQLHTVDSTPGNVDPWYFFNKIKMRLSRKILVNRESGKLLDVELPRVSEDGAAVQQWAQTGGANQQWVTNAQSLTNLQSEKVLDADLNKIDQNGARVQQWTNNGTANQQWSVMDAGAGWVWLRNVMSGKALDVQRDRVHEDGAPLQQWDYAATPNQQWKIVTLPL